MANHKSTKKRIRSNQTKNEGNKYLHKTVRNALRSAFSDSPNEGLEKNKIVSMIDKLEFFVKELRKHIVRIDID